MPAAAPEEALSQSAPAEWRWGLATILLPLIAPAIWLVQGVLTTLDRPPLWQVAPDPAYVYLLNSAELATGQATFANQHPGTPMYWAMAASDWLVHLTTGLGTSLAADVVARPETFLTVAALVLVLLQAAGLVALGLTFTRRFSIGAALLAQALVLVSRPLLDTNVTPVAMQVAAGLFLVAAVGRSFDGRRSPVATVRLVLIGILIAVGLTAKLTFFPALLLPLLLFRPRQLLTIYASGLVFGTVFVFVTVRQELLDGLVWWRNFFLTSGRTPGDTNQRGVITALTDLPSTLVHSLPLVLVAAAAVVACLLAARSRHADRSVTWTPWRAFGTLALVGVAGLLTTVKVFYTQDLLVVPLVGAAVIGVAWAWLTALFPHSRPVVVGATAIPLVLVLAAGAATSVGDGRATYPDASPDTLALAAFMDDARASGTPIASAYGVISPGNALYFGMWLSQRSLAPEITERWPNYVDYKLENGRFYYFTDIGEVEFTCQQLSDLINSPTGLLWVPGRDVTFMTDQPQYSSLTVEPYRSFGDLTVYRFSGVTCPS